MAKFTGTKLDDQIFGSDASDLIKGLGGDDEINGGGGSDTIYGGTGDDMMRSGAPDANQTSWVYGDDGNDSIFGGHYNAFGGAGDDNLWGGYEADDMLYGGDGDDQIVLTSGRDSIFGGQGQDILWLGYNFDEPINFTLGKGGHGIVDLGSFGNTNVTGLTRYFEIEDVVGGSSNDTLTGNSSDNLLSGDSGADSLIGRAGNDILNGGDGHDTIKGGRGHDAFVFFGLDNGSDLTKTSDVITDFRASQDSLLFVTAYFTGLHRASDTPHTTIQGIPIYASLASDFAVQTTSHAHSDGVRLIYDRDDRLLYYDADGALSGYKATLVADIGTDLDLTAANFLLA